MLHVRTMRSPTRMLHVALPFEINESNYAFSLITVHSSVRACGRMSVKHTCMNNIGFPVRKSDTSVHSQVHPHYFRDTHVRHFVVILKILNASSNVRA